MMRQATRVRKRLRSRQLRGSLGEQLEQRILLAGDARNVFATFNGSIAYPNGTQSIAITLSPANFALAQGNVVLGFQVEANGSSLDPTAVQIKDPRGKTVQPIYNNPDLAQNTQSLTLAQLGLGTYTLSFGAERRTSGAYHLAVFLAGDATGNRIVDQLDVKQVQQSYGSHFGDGRYTVEADSNLNGVINAFDLSLALSNRGDSTNLSPLRVSLALSPAPIQLPGGTLVTNQSSVTASGITEPGATVTARDRRRWAVRRRLDDRELLGALRPQRVSDPRWKQHPGPFDRSVRAANYIFGSGLARYRGTQRYNSGTRRHGGTQRPDPGHEHESHHHRRGHRQSLGCRLTLGGGRTRGRSFRSRLLLSELSS